MTVLLGVSAAAALVGWVAGSGLGLRWRRDQAGPALPAAGGQPGPDRDVLVDVCIKMADAVPSEALRSQITRALDAAGVRPIDAAGERFDARVHLAVGSTSTRDPALHGVIACTDRAGWDDRGRAVRPPEVMVYRFESTP